MREFKFSNRKSDSSLFEETTEQLSLTRAGKNIQNKTLKKYSLDNAKGTQKHMVCLLYILFLVVAWPGSFPAELLHPFGEVSAWGSDGVGGPFGRQPAIRSAACGVRPADGSSAKKIRWATPASHAPKRSEAASSIIS